MASAETEGTYWGDIIRWMADALWSIDTWVVGTGQTLVRGSICETSGSTKIILDTAGNADSICLKAVTAAAAGTTAPFLVRGAVVDKNKLNYNSKTESTVDAALKALAGGAIKPLAEPTTSETG